MWSRQNVFPVGLILTVFGMPVMLAVGQCPEAWLHIPPSGQVNGPIFSLGTWDADAA